MSALTSHNTSAPLTSPQPGRDSEQPRHLKLVKQLRRHSAMSRRKLTVFISLLLGVVVLQLALATVMMQDAYRAESLKSERLELQRERTAAIEVADAASSPQQIAQRATKIGMVPSGGYVFLNLDSGTVEGDRGQAGEVAKPINPALVENKAAEPETPEAEKAKPEKRDGAGASRQTPPKPAVPSEFELGSPETH